MDLFARNPAAKARLKRALLKSAPAKVGDFLVLDAKRDTSLIKQKRITGVWKVRALRVDLAKAELKLLLRRAEGGEMTEDDASASQPRNSMWLTARKVNDCLVRLCEPELAVPCPHCGEGVGQPCRRPSGRKHEAPHVDRDLALAAILAPPPPVRALNGLRVAVGALQKLRALVSAKMGYETVARLLPEEGGPDWDDQVPVRAKVRARPRPMAQPQSFPVFESVGTAVLDEDGMVDAYDYELEAIPDWEWHEDDEPEEWDTW